MDASHEFADPPHELPGVSAVNVPVPPRVDDPTTLLQELLGATRELTAAMRSQLELSRQQAEMTRQHLELARRAEQRVEEQRQAQRDDFQRWLGEHQLLGGRSSRAEKTVRSVLGCALTEMVDYIEENDETMSDSDYVRRELADRFGSQLAHLWSIHGVLKHLSAAETAANAAAKPSA